MFNDKSNWVLQGKQGAGEEIRTSAKEVIPTPQTQKRVSEVPRETHYATSDTLFFYQIVLKQILQTEDKPENCSAREKSRLMSLLSLLYLQKRTLALRHAIPSPTESTEGVLKHKM